MWLIKLFFIFISSFFITSNVYAVDNCAGQTCAGGTTIGSCAVGVANRICSCVAKSTGGYIAKYTDETTGKCTGRINYDSSGKPIGLDYCDPSEEKFNSAITGRYCTQCWDGTKSIWQCDPAPTATPRPPTNTPIPTIYSTQTTIAPTKIITNPITSIAPTFNSISCPYLNIADCRGDGCRSCTKKDCNYNLYRCSEVLRSQEYEAQIQQQVQQQEMEKQLILSRGVCSRSCNTGTCVLDIANNKYKCVPYTDTNNGYNDFSSTNFNSTSTNCDIVGSKCCKKALTYVESHSSYAKYSYFCNKNFQCSRQTDLGVCIHDLQYEQATATLNFANGKTAEEAQAIIFSNLSNNTQISNALSSTCFDEITERGQTTLLPCTGACVFSDSRKKFICVDQNQATNFYQQTNSATGKGELGDRCIAKLGIPPYGCNNENLECDINKFKCVLKKEALTRLANDAIYQNLNNTEANINTTGYSLNTSLNTTADQQQAGNNNSLVKNYCTQDKELS